MSGLHVSKQSLVYILAGLVALGALLWARQDKPVAPIKTTTYAADKIPAAGRVLVSMKANGPGQTQVFSAPAEWDAYWSYRCLVTDQGHFMIRAFTPDGQLVAAEKPTDVVGESGFGMQPYHMSVKKDVYLMVDSNCPWHLTAKSR